MISWRSQPLPSGSLNEVGLVGAPLAGPVPGQGPRRVEDSADLGAAADEVRSRRVDVADREQQALSRSRLGCREALPERDRARRVGGCELDHADVFADDDVRVQAPPEALVEALGPVDIGDGQRHYLEPHVDRPRFRRLHRGGTTCVGAARADLRVAVGTATTVALVSIHRAREDPGRRTGRPTPLTIAGGRCDDRARVRDDRRVHRRGVRPSVNAHPTGTLDEAEAILASHPEVAATDIYTVAILGDHMGVQRLLAEDRGRGTAKGGPYGWDALTYLCFSRYLRLRGSDGFVRAAEALLDAGTDPNTGFFEPEHQPAPTFESALYGAAGVAHHAGLTRLLLAHGADPEPRRRGRLPRARGLRQRGDAGRRRERPAGCRRADDDAPSQARLDRRRWRALAARARRRPERRQRLG